jgi:hypothetical protein
MAHDNFPTLGRISPPNGNRFVLKVEAALAKGPKANGNTSVH